MSARGLMLLAAASVYLMTSAGANATTLDIGDQRGNAHAAMQAAKVLSDTPYEIKWHEFPNAAPLLEALNGGHLDGGMVGDAPLTFAAAAGVQAKVVFATRYFGNAVIVGSKSSIKSISELKGKKIATAKGSAGYALAVTALKRAGLSANDVKWIFLGPDDASLALTHGDVDAVASWEPYISFSVLHGDARILVDGRDYPGMNYLIASPDAIKNKRAALVDFIARLKEARLWTAAHPSEYAKVIAQQLRLPEAVALSKVRREVNAPASDVVSVEATQQATIDLFHDVGLTPKTFPATDIIDPQFFGGTSKP